MAFESLFSILIALMVGAGYPLQAGINASIAKFHGHPLLAALTNTTVASLVLLVAVIVLRVPLPQVSGLVSAPCCASWAASLWSPA